MIFKKPVESYGRANQKGKTMCDLTIEKPLHAISESQIAELTTNEIIAIIQTGSPNYLTLQSMALELAKRATANTSLGKAA